RDAGERTFGEAFHRFCRAAGLTTGPSAPETPANPRAGVTGSIVVMGGGIRGGRTAVPTDILQPPAAEARPTIVLTDGKHGETPIYYGGAVRLQVAPTSEAPPATDIHLTLEARVEPALNWQKVIGTRIQKAVDDQGQILKPLPVPVRERPPANAQRGVVI